jgi:hypothetical protein
MSTNTQKNIEDQEIDVSIVFKKINGFFQGISTSIFRGIQFIIKNIIVIGILFIIGAGLGIYLDKTEKKYDHQIIVQPNFGSTDYLFSKIDLIQSKIRERDTVFLKAIGILEPTKLLKIEINPIVDVNKFVNVNSDQNFELLKLMAENGDIKKIVEDKVINKNYSLYLISFSTDKLVTAKQVIDPLMKFLNTSSYYSKIQKEYVNNVMVKMKANDVIIAQIDGFLNSFSNTVNGNSKSDKLVYYNENTQLNDVIQTKNKLIGEQGALRMNLVSLDKIIKEESSTINILNNQLINGKLKLFLPIFFIFIFIFINFFINFYKKQLAKSK